MTDSSIAKTYQIGEFFSVAEEFPVNLHPLAEGHRAPDEVNFLKEIPELYLMASQMAGSEQDLLHKLAIENPKSPSLVSLLENMTQRMTLMLGYLLRYEDNPDYRFNGVEFGGGGLRVHSVEPIAEQQSFQAKLFFRAESLAIYCYLRSVSCVASEDTGGYISTFEFERIQDSDRENLIRASLHAQSRQLKERAQQRLQDNKTEE